MSHTFSSVTNLTVLSRFTFSSISKVYKFTSFIWFNSLISFKVPHIQKCNKVNGLISFYILISFNSPTYSTLSQIQLYYLISHSCLIQQSHIFKSATKSMVLSRFTFSSPSTVPLIQHCHKFSCIIYFHVHISFNSPNIFNSLIWFNSLISFNSPNKFNNVPNSTVLSDSTV